MSDKSVKRNLPSWMSSRDHGSKTTDFYENDEISKGEKSKEAKGGGKMRTSVNPSTDTLKFSTLLEGVVIVLSGFVNPERSTLRSQALEMGAEYQPDWNSDCTLLICAFPNTPKFRQVQADCGTIVSKEWISDCYKEKKLVDIDSYLMNAGKPWRKSNVPLEISQDKKASPHRRSKKQIESGSHSESTTSIATKDRAPIESFSPSTLKKWAIDDLNRTVTWLESQEEKPEPSEIKKIAAEGILVCLQDAIDSLEQKQDVRKITEQWSFIPRAVEELAKLEGTETGLALLTKEDLYSQAKVCRKIYETTLTSLADDSTTKQKRPKTNENRDAGYDSEDTIEMTEEEIDLAYKTMSSVSKSRK